ncbi:MAG: transketolase [Clostridium sp.]|uniref:transketolase n=1 Tax=Clostridium sp. TaxID=1506 RepID=UPI003055FF06
MVQNEINKLAVISKVIRKDIINMSYKANSSHVGSSLSIVDILTILYFKILNISKDNYKDRNRDKLILSKGHASMGLYSVLARSGLIDEEILDTYYMDGSPLSGHPKKNALPGIEVSTGSLGHGLAMGCGLALSDKNDNKECKTVVIMGDGECNEGSIWEAAIFATTNKLNNLIVIIDNNNLQGLGRVDEVASLYPLGEKWKAFNWNVKEINGHDLNEIYIALKDAYKVENKPIVIIAHTVKGKGVSFMEDRMEWHYKSPNGIQYKTAMEELV